MKNSLLLLSLLLLLYSCKKDENAQFQNYTCSDDCYIIEGVVLHGQDSIPLSGVTLTFSNYINQWNTDLLAIKTSDSEGRYRYEMPKSYFDRDANSVSVEASLAGFTNSPSSSLVRLDSSTVNVPVQNDFTLFEGSKLIINVSNNETTNFGSVSIRLDFNLENVSDLGNVMHDSPTFQDQLEYTVPSDLPFEVSWRTYDSSLEIEGSIVITVPRNETRTIQINL